MSKKSKIILILASLLLIILWVLWYCLTTPKVVLPASEPIHPSASQVTPSAATPTTASNPTNGPPMTPQQIRLASEAEANREKALWDLAFMTPISFYGKVMDEKGNPISGAKAVMRPADAMMGGTTEYQRTTDSDGLFSILTHGVGLTVDVSKKGYYTLPESSGNFGYAAGSRMQPPHPNSKNPAIFILRKMGETEPLIMFQRFVKIPRNGAPTQMNLTTGKAFGGANGDIQVEAWTHDRDTPQGATRPYDWRCRITVLGSGGLQPRTGGVFDFIAPESGYQPNDEIDMSSSDPKWRTSQSREYFLKLANGEYARINFTMHAGGDHFFDVTSYLNPQAGHRNLEYDPAKQINK